MSLTQIAADVRNDLTALQTNAQADYNRLKAATEAKLPEIERVAAMLDSDPLVQLAVGEFVPAPLRAIAAEAVSAVVKAFQAAPAPAAPAEAPADPQQPAA